MWSPCQEAASDLMAGSLQLGVDPVLGLVLAGGAARGAYEAGVLRFMFGELSRRLGRPVWPDLVSGTSVGALNGVFAASRSSQRLNRLTEVWRTMSIEQVYTVDMRDVVGTLKSAFGGTRSFSMLDPSPLRKLVTREHPVHELRRAIGSGATRALILSATQLSTGYNVLFVDSAARDLELDPLPGARVDRVQMKPEHLLASSALPFLFRPIEVGDQLFVDGGIRQNTPLRPVLHAGADRVLVIGLHISKETEGRTPMRTVTASVPFLAGKVLNALMIDPVERDLIQAARINQIVAWGCERYGPGFADAIREDLGMRPVDVMFFRPERDLGRIANTIYRSRPPKAGREIDWLLRTLVDRANAAEGESDMLSYLFFDRAFTSEIEQLGYEDAEKREEELVAFLDRRTEREHEARERAAVV